MIDGFGRNQPPRLQGPPKAVGAGVPTPAAGTAAPNAAKPVTNSRASGTAAQLSAAARTMAARPPVDAARVAELRAAMVSGHYKVNPEAIASRMIAFDRGSGRS